MIQFDCEHCGKSHIAPEEFAGRKLRCKGCTAVLEIPSDEVPDGVEEDVSSYIEEDLAEGQEMDDGMAFGDVEDVEEVEEIEDVEEVEEVEDVEEVEEIEEEPARKIGKGKPSFKPPKKKFQSKIGKKGSGLGAKKKGGPKRLQVSKVRGLDRQATPDEDGGSKKKLMMVGAVVVGLLLILGGIYFFKPDLLGLGPSDDGPRKVTRAPKSRTDGAKEDAKESSLTGGSKEDVTSVEEVKEPVDVLSVIPGDMDLLLHVDVEKLVAMPFIKGLLEQDMSDPPEGVAQFMEKSGIDLERDIRDVWAAFVIPDPEKMQELTESGPLAAASEMVGMFLVEGTIDQEKLISALGEVGVESDEGAELGDLMVHETVKEGEDAGSFTFLSPEQLLVANSTETIERAAELDASESVKTNDILKTLTQDFQAQNVFWLAARIREGMIPPMAEGAPAPNINGLFLSVDPLAGGNGISLRAAASCATAQDVGAIQLMLGMFQTMLPEDVRNGLKVEPQDTVLRLSLDLPEELLQKLPEMFMPQIGEMSPEDLEMLEGLEEGEKEDGTEGIPESLEESGIEIKLDDLKMDDIKLDDIKLEDIKIEDIEIDDIKEEAKIEIEDIKIEDLEIEDLEIEEPEEEAKEEGTDSSE